MYSEIRKNVKNDKTITDDRIDTHFIAIGRAIEILHRLFPYAESASVFKSKRPGAKASLRNCHYHTF